MKPVRAELVSEDEQMSFAGRGVGTRRGADAYEGEGDGEAVRAVLYSETPGDEADAGSAHAGLQRGGVYPDKHHDKKHPVDDTVVGGMGNHIHPRGDGEEADKGLPGPPSASGEIAGLLKTGERGEAYGTVHQHDEPGDTPIKQPGSNAPGDEAEPVQAEWYSGGDEPESPHEDDEDAHDVPTGSFVDDIRRKLSIRRVMPGGDAQDMKGQPGGQKAGEAEDSLDKDQRGVPIPAEPIWSKEETNYRYASDPQRSCGDCRFFVEPAACRLVMGMILKTDVCDKFEAERKPQDDAVRASMATESDAPVGRAEMFREAGQNPSWGMHAGGAGYKRHREGCTEAACEAGCPVGVTPEDALAANRRANLKKGTEGDGSNQYQQKGGKGGRTVQQTRQAMKDTFPENRAKESAMKTRTVEAGPPWFARHKNGENIGLQRLLDIRKGMEAIGYESPLGEVSPPGWEGTVKAMKKSKGIDNPWALAWYMKGKGYQPHKEEQADPSAALGAKGDAKTDRNKQLDAGKGVMLPGKQAPTKLHPGDKAVGDRWGKQDGRTERHGDPRQRQRPSDHSDQDDMIERRREKESDVIRRLARRLKEEGRAEAPEPRKPVREAKSPKTRARTFAAK